MIQKIFQSNDNKRLFTNFLSLSVLQGTNLLLPLVTFPYLVRVLGIEKFGLISFALATVSYFEILAEYGFDLSATRQISINRSNLDKVTSIYSSVLSLKAMLSVVSFLLLTILVFSFHKFSDFFLIYYFTFGRVIGKSLFPVWFFQGMEKMKITTTLDILTKAVFTVAIFVFVKEEKDFLLVPIFNSLGFLSAGLLAIIQIKSRFGVSFKIQSIETLREHLKDGWHIFVSRIYVNIYTTTNIFLLGLMTNNIIVGYYSVAVKIVDAVASLMYPANNALYPYMSKLFHDNVEKFYQLVKRMSWFYFAVAFSLFAGAAFFGRWAVTFVNGSFDEQIYVIYNVLLFKILLSPYAPFFTQIFINQGRKIQYLGIVKYTFILNLLIVPLFIHFYAGLGMAVGALLVTIFHLSLFLKFKIRPEQTLL